MYKLRNLSGKSDTGTVNLSFLSASYYEKKSSKNYAFDKYNQGIAETVPPEDDNDARSIRKAGLKNYHFDDDIQNEIDPIKTDSSDSSFLFNNEDAIVFDLKRDGKPRK